jgi:phosphopantothenoylcysteine decarboxylase/phosphopantothenate--cysteine ligase
MWKGKRVVLGITGGIAAYKAAELTREIVRRQAAVRVVMTRHAREFITPLTLETLSGNRVCTDLFAPEAPHEIDHIALARWADVLIVAPATANLIGKAAGGIADDLLTTTLLATRAPVLLCPAMNDAMWENPIVGENLDRLRRRGCAVVEPARGSLACGTEGAGRLADLGDILNAAEALFTPQDFSGETVLVTAGPTREPLDPVRFITNYSSGKMGYAIAHAARMRGASVILVSGRPPWTRRAMWNSCRCRAPARCATPFWAASRRPRWSSRPPPSPITAPSSARIKRSRNSRGTSGSVSSATRTSSPKSAGRRAGAFSSGSPWSPKICSKMRAGKCVQRKWT